jgi:hypothetical protein
MTKRRRARHTKRNGSKPFLPDSSYTTSEFAQLERVSRAFLYLLWERGEGPRFFYAGNRRRISHQARLDWQREREAAAAAVSREISDKWRTTHGHPARAD